MAQINIKKNDAAYVSTPPSGIQTIFVADSGDLYTMDSSGTVTLVGGGGGSGSSGTSGSSGIDGTSGSSGSSGVSGSSGSSGVSGSSGSSGVSGSSGSSGVNGSSGSSGVSGSSGSSGVSGLDGSSGSSGTSGIDGTSGISGSYIYITENTTTGSVDILAPTYSNNGVADGTSDTHLNQSIYGADLSTYNGNTGDAAYIQMNSDSDSPRIFIKSDALSGATISSIEINPTTFIIRADEAPIKLLSNIGVELGTPTTPGYTIPVTDGSAGDVLTTDGAGVASWQAAGGGGGGEAGLVAGPGTNSVQSNTTLTPGASASSGNSIAIGNDVILGIGSTNSTSIGNDNLVPEESTDSLVLGSGNLKTVNAAIKFKKSVILGYGNYISNTNASSVSGVVLIGENNRYNTLFSSGEGDGSVLIGRNNQITSGNSSPNVVIGSGNSVNRFRNVAVGDNLTIQSDAIGAIAMGAGPTVNGELAIAMGYNNSASGYSVSLGYGSNTNGNTTVGLFGAASGNNSFAASGGSVNATGAMAVGSGAVATHNYAYVFGHSLSSQFVDTTHVDRLSIKNVDVYADNAAAITGGLTASQVYRTSTGVLMIVF